MKILVIGDTHGVVWEAEYAIKSNSDVSVVVHLGDNYRDAMRLEEKFPGIRFEYVSGNCDYASEVVDSEKLLEYLGHRFFITHGHLYSVKQSYKRLFKRASELKAEIVLTGHTHQPCIDQENGIILLNPGSISQPRGSAFGSYAIIEVTKEILKTELVSV
ncbi:MAG: metallophosphoesterase [Clostridiales bacterium]|nr:metallophosphoesterase [Clostridiales bacterium]